MKKWDACVCSTEKSSQSCRQSRLHWCWIQEYEQIGLYEASSLSSRFGNWEHKCSCWIVRGILRNLRRFLRNIYVYEFIKIILLRPILVKNTQIADGRAHHLVAKERKKRTFFHGKQNDLFRDEIYSRAVRRYKKEWTSQEPNYLSIVIFWKLLIELKRIKLRRIKRISLIHMLSKRWYQGFWMVVYIDCKRGAQVDLTNLRPFLLVGDWKECSNNFQWAQDLLSDESTRLLMDFL